MGILWICVVSERQAMIKNHPILGHMYIGLDRSLDEEWAEKRKGVFTLTLQVERKQSFFTGRPYKFC